MYGIENLKKLVKFGCDLTRQITTALADGWQWTDALGFINEIAAIPGVVKSIPAIQQELKDLTPEERAELYAYLVTEFELPDEKVEAFVENALALAISVLALVEQWKALQPAAEVPAPVENEGEGTGEVIPPAPGDENPA